MTDKNTQTNLEEEPMANNDGISPETVDEMPDVTDSVDDTSADSEPQSDLEIALAQVNEFKDALQRERADFSNFRKRTEREKSEMRAIVIADTVKQFLPVVDDFDRAWTNIPEDMRENDWLKGFALINKKFRDLLDSFGIEVLDPLGETFDHNFHDAIGSEDSDEYESGTVLDVLQKGYVMNGKCIRPAIVRVAN